MAMKYKVGDKVKVITTDTCGFGFGYTGKITKVDTGDYEIDGQYWYDIDEIETVVKPKPIRGFQRIKGFEDIPLPTRATKHSAGYDLGPAIDITIVPNATVVIPTGIKAYMQDNEFLGLYIRSSMGKMGLTMSTSVSIIDSDYFENPDNDGHIMILLRNDSSFPIDIAKGTRLVQGVFHTYLCTGDDNATSVRQGGTGSTSMPS